jgi:hypothetical protein
MCRRYMGHKRTIRPNAKKLNILFQTRNQLGWDAFSRKVQKVQRGLMGEPDDIRPKQDDFHEFPSSCICLRKPGNISVTTWKPDTGHCKCRRQHEDAAIWARACCCRENIYACFERNTVELTGQGCMGHIQRNRCHRSVEMPWLGRCHVKESCQLMICHACCNTLKFAPF